MRKTILLTGATSGIGWSTANRLAQKNNKLILCGRNKEKLEELKKQYTDVSITTLCFDIRKKEEIVLAVEKVKKLFKKIDVLINNAGNAFGWDTILNANLQDWDDMIDTNFRGLISLTKQLIPLMKNTGHIINISSIAGKESYPKGSVYCASKAAIQSFSDVLRIELLEYGIKVSVVSPGAVNTNFSVTRFQGDRKKADKVYEGFTPLTGDDIATVIDFMISIPEHVNISDLTILPKAQAGARDIYKQ